MSMPAPPGYGQGTGGTDIVSALKGIIQQITNGNANVASLVTQVTDLVAAVNNGFPKTLDGYTVATLPAAPPLGSLAYVTDGTSSLSWGATVTGGHSEFYLCTWNGANWTVVGK